jgi:hypothetical protein
VDKVGSATGWTSGLVTRTCIDSAQQGTSVALICQYFANYGNAGGDSGSPVFQWSGSGTSVTLVGLHWGRSASGSDGVFSPIGGIEVELPRFRGRVKAAVFRLLPATSSRS